MYRSSRRHLSFPEPFSPELSPAEPPHTTCELCKQCHNKENIALVRTWKIKGAIYFMTQRGITGEQSICYPCRSDIRRVIQNPGYTPRWNKQHPMKSCYIKDCKENVFVTSNMADTEELKCTLNECSFECTSSTVPIPTPHCKHHCHVTYKHLQPQQSNCSTCETSLKHVNNRVCPDPKVIEAHLRNT